MGSRVAYIEQNREKFNIKIPKKFLGFQGAMFDVFGLPETAVSSRRGKLVVACDHLFLQKSPLWVQGNALPAERGAP